jgi:hypothetical protein
MVTEELDHVIPSEEYIAVVLFEPVEDTARYNNKSGA